MWPWEHVAFGYCCYSLFRHGWYGEPPSDRTAVVVVFAALLPDLVDKPLSWSAEVFATGYAIGHSVFALVAVLAVAVVVRRRDRGHVGAAFGIGYASHLVGDVVYPALLGEGLAVERVLWPLVTLPPYEDRLGLLARTLVYLHRYVVRALSGDISTAVAVQFVLVFAVFVLWLYDGAPGVAGLLPSKRSVNRR